MPTVSASRDRRLEEAIARGRQLLRLLSDWVAGQETDWPADIWHRIHELVGESAREFTEP